MGIDVNAAPDDSRQLSLTQVSQTAKPTTTHGRSFTTVIGAF